MVADDGHLARIVFFDHGFRLGQAFARHLDKVRFLFGNERRTVLGAKANDLLVVPSLTGRAIFHRHECGFGESNVANLH